MTQRIIYTFFLLLPAILLPYTILVAQDRGGESKPHHPSQDAKVKSAHREMTGENEVMVKKAEKKLTMIAKSNKQQQSVPVWTYTDLEKNILSANSDTTYILNFWATWCKPCVEELPAFEQLTKQTQGKKVRVILLSLDFKKDRETKVLPFIRSRGIVSHVVVFSEPDQNTWIDRISPEWSGAIPVTLVFNKTKGIREFYEKQFSYQELLTIVQRIN